MHINLPGISGISGIEALKALAADARTAHIPVIAVSANAMPRDIETGLAAGFFRDLTKPIKLPEFMQTLDLALRTSRAGQPAAATINTETDRDRPMKIDPLALLAARILSVRGSP